MRKIFGLFAVVLGVLAVAGCGSKTKLYVLNWTDYINEDLLTQFEEEFDCKVVYSTTDDNPKIYSAIVNQTGNYDVAFPSDYMIGKLKSEGLINPLDYSKLPNYTEGMYVDELETLFESDACISYDGYFVPYFWSSLGIMYNTTKAGLADAVTTNGWKVFFEPELLPAGTTVGMYDSSRDSLAVAEMYLGYEINTTNMTEIDAAFDVLGAQTYAQWGTNDLKQNVSNGNLDLAMVFAGDFFDAYYAKEASGQPVNFDMYAPTSSNNIFFDSMVIPTTSQNVDLAYEFINFMMDFDNAYANAEYVGYSPVISSVVDYIFESPDWEGITSYPSYNPALIVSTPGSKAQVYTDLGDDLYASIEQSYEDMRLA